MCIFLIETEYIVTTAKKWLKENFEKQTEEGNYKKHIKSI